MNAPNATQWSDAGLARVLEAVKAEPGHTAGPWSYAGSGSAGAGGMLLGPDRQPIAVVYSARTNPNAERDGHLMEAAPDLLQAAQMALRFLLNAGHRHGDVPMILREAIAKATGEQS